MLEDQGNFHTSRGTWLRSADVDKMNRFPRQHRLDEHFGQIVIACEDRIARPRYPIEQQLGGKLFGMYAGLQEMPEQ
jgi:hypothetical protein